jgi:hypothetical protein
VNGGGTRELARGVHKVMPIPSWLLTGMSVPLLNEIDIDVVLLADVSTVPVLRPVTDTATTNTCGF